MSQVSNSIQAKLTLPYTQRPIEVVKSKFFLLDVCFEKALNFISQGYARGFENRYVAVLDELRRLICAHFVTLA